jgi:hypothetical protein
VNIYRVIAGNYLTQAKWDFEADGFPAINPSDVEMWEYRRGGWWRVETNGEARLNATYILLDQLEILHEKGNLCHQ